MLELVIDFPARSYQLSRVIVVDLGRHIVVVPTPLSEPEGAHRGTNLLFSHHAVGKPCLGVRLAEIGFHLCCLILVIAIIDILQIQQLDSRKTIGGKDKTTFRVGILAVEVGNECLQIQMVTFHRCIVLTLVEYPVVGLYLQGG